MSLNRHLHWIKIKKSFHYRYDDTLTRNNLTMARNNTFSTLGRNRNNNDRQNYSNLGLNNLGFEDSRYESAFSQKYRFNAVLPVTDSVFNR